MSKPMLEGKSHDIPKRLVWEAWLKVKKNGGAGGAVQVSECDQPKGMESHE